MAQFENTFKNFMLLGLMVFGILAFVIIGQTQNNATESILDSATINNTYTNLRTDFEGFQEEAQSQKLLFESETPTLGFGTLLFYSIISSGKVFNSMVGALFNTIIKLPTIVLGLDPILIGVISAMLILSIIVGLWIIYKVGG